MDFDVLKKHVGHNIVCVEYNNGSVTYATALECEDCKEMLDVARKRFAMAKEARDND